MKTKTSILAATKVFFISLIVCCFFSSCADVQPQVMECVTGYQYGFFGGLWHGIIAPVSFIGSLFSDDIAVWAINNNGGWYAFGFVLGIGALTGSSYTTVSK
jgi:hypothetical protein